MPTKNAKSSSTTKSTIKSGKTVPEVYPSTDRFPFAQYASVLGVHLMLVGFTALYLPQTTRFFVPVIAQKSDRPQSEFMVALTADPSLTMCWISLGLILLQAWWANWMRKWSFEQTAKGTEIDIKLDRIKFDGLRFTRFKDATAFTLWATLAIHIVVVVFGAPFTTHFLRTALLAFVIALLTVFTPATVLGLPSWASDTPSLINRLTWTRLFAELSPRNAIEFAMVYPAFGTFIGAWLGAIPIALDWDRPWQAWPLTPLFGSLGGYITGAFLGLVFSTTKLLASEQIQLQSSRTKSS